MLTKAKVSGQSHQKEPQLKAKAGTPKSKGEVVTETNANMVDESSLRTGTSSTRGSEIKRLLKKKPDFLRIPSTVQTPTRSHTGPLMKTIETIETTDPGERTTIITNALATMRGRENPGSRRGEKITEIPTLIFLDPNRDKDMRRGASRKITLMIGICKAAMIGRTGVEVRTPDQEDSILRAIRETREMLSAEDQ